MKKNVKLVFLCLGLVLFTTVNYWCVASDSFEIASRLFLANIEGLASQESELPKQSTERHNCTLIRRVIVGYYWENGVREPIIEQQKVDGAQGDCTGKPGPCDPWPCTEENISH